MPEMPARHPVVEQRLKDLAEFGESTYLNRVEMGGTDLGIITSGTAYQYVKEVFGDNVSVLKLGLIWPLPAKLITDFAARVKKLVVVEELDGFLEDYCRQIGLVCLGKELFPNIDEFSQNIVRRTLGLAVPQGRKLDAEIPPRPPVMCAGCPHRGFFYSLAKAKANVIGDIGATRWGPPRPKRNGFHHLHGRVGFRPATASTKPWERKRKKRASP
jgi:indolepyruvate ferredoxin oxidoreductase alpha subunit